MIVEADGRWYTGPGNGLFELVQRRAPAVRGYDIHWQPEALCASFHGRDLERARTFSDKPQGAAFWYENANGLAEIAVNLGRADSVLGLKIGSPVEVIS